VVAGLSSSCSELPPSGVATECLWPLASRLKKAAYVVVRIDSMGTHPAQTVVLFDPLYEVH
jgi:hypothetical protein